MTHRPPEPPRLRPAVTRATAAPMAWLAGRPAAAFVTVLVLAIVTFAVPGPVSVMPGLALLVLLGLTTYLSWPVLPPQGRALRAAVLLVVALLLFGHAFL